MSRLWQVTAYSYISGVQCTKGAPGIFVGTKYDPVIISLLSVCCSRENKDFAVRSSFGWELES